MAVAMATAATNNAEKTTIIEQNADEKLQADLDLNQKKLNFFNNLYLWAVAVAVLAGGMSFVGNVGTSRYSATVSILQDKISKQKDRDLDAYKKSADAKIAEAAQALASANTEIARLNLADTQLQARNLELESQIAPRRLMQPNMALVQTLDQMAPKIIRVSSYGLDPESAVLATQIMEFFGSQHFNLQDDRMNHSGMGGFGFGVRVTGPNTVLNDAIIAVLQSANIFAVSEPMPPENGIMLVPSFPSQPDASIFVGLKPLPGTFAPP